MGKLKLKEVMALLKAGYTKDEIAEFKALENEPEPDPEPAADPKPAADPEPDPEPHYVDEIAKLTEQVNQLTALVQDGFRKQAEGKTPEPTTGDQILKDIIEKGVI